MGQFSIRPERSDLTPATKFFLQPIERAFFDLTHTLTRDTQHHADRGQGLRVFAGQADAFGQSRQSADELTYRL